MSRPLRRALPAALALAFALVAGCATGADDPADDPAAGPAPTTAVAAPSPTEGPRYSEPADACKQLPAALRKQLDVASAKKSSTSDCVFEIGDDKYASLSIHVTYESFRADGITQTTYRVYKDIALRGKGINTSLKGGGELPAVGGAKAGRDYDEGYYAYSVVEMAGITQGWLYTGYRKGNVVIGVDVSGHRLIPPYSGVLRSKAYPEARLRKVLDAVALPLLAAARPA
jgi:hypothetical protein